MWTLSTKISKDLSQPRACRHKRSLFSIETGGAVGAGANTHRGRNSRTPSVRKLSGSNCSHMLASRSGIGTSDRARLLTLVKTFRSDVLPLAPSPLQSIQISSRPVRCFRWPSPEVREPGPLPPPAASRTHSKTSFRCTVLLPPMPHTISDDSLGSRADCGESNRSRICASKKSRAGRSLGMPGCCILSRCLVAADRGGNFIGVRRAQQGHMKPESRAGDGVRVGARHRVENVDRFDSVGIERMSYKGARKGKPGLCTGTREG